MEPLEFAPSFTHRHLQTVFGTLFRRPPRLRTNSEVWTTEDGDLLDVDLLPERAGAPGVIVLHGLEGSSHAHYVRGTLARIASGGLNGAALNFRSCGPSPHRFVRTYHSGFTEDLDAVAARLAARWGAPLGAIGFSLGGNVLLKWLGERGAESPVSAAAAVSVPYDLAACARSLDGGGFWAGLYRGRFLRTLKKKALAAGRRFPGALDLDAVAAARTFAEFDECVTARANGFAGARDYWERSSSARFLAAIRRPTLLLSAEDDPFIPPAAIPRETIGKNPMLSLALFPHGGHVGFVEGWLRPSFAAERLAVAFVSDAVMRRAPPGAIPAPSAPRSER